MLPPDAAEPRTEEPGTEEPTTTIVDCSGVGPGGITRVLTEVARHWPVGHQLELVAVPGQWSAPDGVWVLSGRPGGRARTIAAAAALLRRRTQRARGRTGVLSLSPSLAIAGSRLPVTTVLHDFAFRLWPADLSAAVRRYRQLSYRTAVRRSARLVCVSERTRHDLVGLYGARYAPARVWTPGSDLSTVDGTVPAALAAVRERGGSYLVVAGHAGHKGVELAIGALADHPRYSLAVLTGGQRVPRFAQAAAASPAADRIVLLDRLSDADYRTTLRHAAAFLMPSHFEGYGLPAAEALQLGTPTVISPDPALHEATGGAAIRMASWTAAALSAALHGLATPVTRPAPRSWATATADLFALVHGGRSGMRIALVHSSFGTAGGAERYLRDLARSLTERGHQVSVLARPSAGAAPGDHPVPARLASRLPLPRKLATHLGDLLDPTGLGPAQLRALRPDVVHVHNWQGLGILPLARLARAFPTCHTVHDYALCDPANALAHGPRGSLPAAALRLRSRWLVRRLRRVTLFWPAQRAREIAARYAPTVAGLPARIVPLAVPATGQPAPPPGSPQVFLFLGALSSHKGVDVLLDAWSRLAGGGTLLIAGNGELREEVLAAAQRDPSVQYLGYLDPAGKAAALARAGWLVAPSRCPETFGISCAEALIAGRPIIASAVARPAMAADDSLLVFDGGAADLAAQLRAAMTDSADRYRQRAESATRDGARLDWSGHLDAVEAGYAAVAGRETATRVGQQ